MCKQKSPDMSVSDNLALVDLQENGDEGKKGRVVYGVGDLSVSTEDSS